MTVIVGSSNTDGRGSASSLTPENGLELNMEYTRYEGSWDGNGGGIHYNDRYDDIFISKSWDHYGYERIEFTNIAEWNHQGLKEISINDDGLALVSGQYGDMYVGNFVDVSLTLTRDLSEETGSSVVISGAKRGEIDVSELNDGVDMFILPQSNGPSWSNLFTVSTSNSSDSLDFYSDSLDQGSHWTEFDVSLNGGNDYFSHRLDASSSSQQMRYVDGGDGIDTLNVYKNPDDLSFSNFEIIEGQGDYTLTLDEQLLSGNNADTAPLTVNDLSIEFAEGYDYLYATYDQVHDDPYEGDEIEYTVVVSYDDTAYYVLTDSLNEGWDLVV